MNELEILKRRVEREKKARKEAEAILEVKALELFQSNKKLQEINSNLESEILLRSEEIRASEFKHRSIIENLKLGILEIDTKGIITKVYNSFSEMTSFSEADLLGKNGLELLKTSKEDKDLALRDYDGKVIEGLIPTKGDNEIWTLVNAAPLRDNEDTIYGYMAFFYDINDRKVLEENLRLARKKAEAAEKAEKEFLANMSHEIRTPLNAIIGMTHLLLDSELSASQNVQLETLSSSASLLKNLISDILDFSKIDSGKLELSLEKTNLEKECVKLINIFKAKGGDGNVVFNFISDRSIEHMVMCDPSILNQVLVNLLGNAAKFTSKGEVSLSLKMLEKSEKQVKVLFQVKDTGVGIKEDKLKSIFDDFSQANTEARTQYGGTGLGLSISKKLVELMDSQISVQSVYGEGSLFEFSLALEKSEALHKNKVVQEEKVNDLEQAQLHILIAEDNEVNLMYISTLMSKWKVKADIARNGKEALKLFLENSHNLILMDIQMPEMDGYEATKRIRTSDQENKNVPIIALTASTFVSNRNEAYEAGMTDFLSKPFSPEQLSAIISKYSAQLEV